MCAETRVTCKDLRKSQGNPRAQALERDSAECVRGLEGDPGGLE